VRREFYCIRAAKSTGIRARRPSPCLAFRAAFHYTRGGLQTTFGGKSTGMSELREQRWSVVSERGCEASGATYEEAAGLVRRLRGDKVHGLCVISDEAARRYNSNNHHATMAAAEPAHVAAPEAATPAPPAKKRAPRRKNAKLS
jgi:hypothetical protein